MEKKCWRVAERSSEERRELEREDEEREEEEGRLGTATGGIYSRLARQLRGHVAIVGRDRDLLRRNSSHDHDGYRKRPHHVPHYRTGSGGNIDVTGRTDRSARRQTGQVGRGTRGGGGSGAPQAGAGQ